MHSSNLSRNPIVIPKPLTQLGRAIDGLSFVAATLAGLMMLVTAALTGYEIISRYVFNSPTYWTLQVSIYNLIWFGFISLAYVQRTGRHVQVDLLLQRLDDHSRLLWNILGVIFSLLFTLVFTYLCFDFFHEAWSTDETSPDMLSAPMWIPKLSLLIGPGILGLQLVRDLLSQIVALLTYRDEPRLGLNAARILPIVIYLAALLVAWRLYYVSPAVGLVAFMLFLLFGGIPIYAALGLVGMAGMAAVYGGFGALNTVPNIAYGGLNHFGLASLPLFILAGQILERSGAGKELYDMCSRWMGGLPGGMAGATILACAIFSAISISSVATAATIGLIALPELARRNYDRPFSYGVLASGGTLGLMIPPSGTMIIYSAVTDESLGQLFMAGLLPGIMITALFVAYSVYYCKRTGRYDRMDSPTWADRIDAVKTGIWGLLAPIIILVGIYSGIFTPLEAAAVVVIYSLLMSIARRKIGLRDVLHILRECCATGGMLLAIIAAAMILGTFVTLLQIPTQTTEFIQASGLPGWAVIASLMVLFFILGMFLEVVSVMLITLPVVYPLITSMGFSGIWFAVLVTINMEIALVTPPVGLNLYVITGLTDAPMSHVLRGVTPFFLLMLMALVLIALFPDLSTWLPTAMFK